MRKARRRKHPVAVPVVHVVRAYVVAAGFEVDDVRLGGRGLGVQRLKRRHQIRRRRYGALLRMRAERTRNRSRNNDLSHFVSPLYLNNNCLKYLFD